MARTRSSTDPQPVAPATKRSAVFAQPGFVRVYAVGVAWSLCRWAIGFLGAYVVTEATGSPRLVQLTGALLWAPLLLAGVVGGVISDRFARRTILLIQFGVLGPLTAGVGLLLLRDSLPLPLLYLYMVVAGLGWVIDMTVRRALVYDLVGDDHIDSAMAFEGLASAFGLIVGALGGGALIAVAGSGGAYLAVAALIAVAAAILLAVPADSTVDSTANMAAAPVRPPSLRAELVAGIRMVGRIPHLASVLGITALVNFFHFSYFPIVPVIARRVDATPITTGLLASATGMGMAVGAIIILRGTVLRITVRRGAAYVIGAGGAFVFLIGFGAFDTYWLVFGSLLLASSFVGLFAATQSALVMTSVAPEMRGRAMGLLSMAIGMLPIGMAVLGEISEWLGAPTALILANSVGLIVFLAFVARRPEAFRVG